MFEIFFRSSREDYRNGKSITHCRYPESTDPQELSVQCQHVVKSVYYREGSFPFSRTYVIAILLVFLKTPLISNITIIAKPLPSRCVFMSETILCRAHYVVCVNFMYMFLSRAQVCVQDTTCPD